MNTTLPKFAQRIVKLNRSLGVSESQIGSTEWIKHFHTNCKADINPNITFEDCQKVIWDVLVED